MLLWYGDDYSRPIDFSLLYYGFSMFFSYNCSIKLKNCCPKTSEMVKKANTKVLIVACFIMQKFPFGQCVSIS